MHHNHQTPITKWDHTTIILILERPITTTIIIIITTNNSNNLQIKHMRLQII